MYSKYPLVSNKYLRKYLYGYDYLSNMLIPKKFIQQGNVKRLLLRNPAALGDVFYTLRLIHAIKEANPGIFIGLLVGSWALPLVKYCLDVDAIHIEDHWILNRSNMSNAEKIVHWLFTRCKVIKEIKQKRYDMAIDLYYYYPSAASLLWQTEIPERVGYDSHEGSAFYTKVIRWKNIDIHNVEYQANLVKKALIPVADLSSAHVKINFSKSDIDLLKSHSLVEKKYLVISVGSGDIKREWKLENWQILLKHVVSLLKTGEIHCIVFVGAGIREEERILTLTKGLSNGWLSLCNQLSIPELMQIIKNARLFIGLESFAGHIAAMYKIPQVSIMHGSTKKAHWEPFDNPYCTVIRKKMGCSPCYFPSRCQYENVCIDISAELVWQKVKENLSMW